MAPCKARDFRLPAVAAMALALVTSPAQPQTAEQFYRAKTISMIVPADPGGSYDLHARLVARHIGKWIPGRPNVIVQNMAGAGGLRAINFLYEKGAQDGTVLGIPVQETILADVLGNNEVRYDVANFNWVGRVASSVDLIVTWRRVPVRTIADAKTAVVPFGATGPASGTVFYPMMLNNIVGTKFNIIPGYRHHEMLLAMERGETGGAYTSLTTLKTAFSSWITEKKVNVLLVTGSERVPEFTDVPALVELGSSAEEKQVLAIFASAETIGRSFLATPRVPSDRVAALRTAFDGMIKDPEFLADVGKTQTEFAPMTGEAL
jgi:tripartite-type tricarboxylate transporter receptor subunit TctC